MLYNPPSGSSDANAPYVGKNTAGGTQGSKVPPAAVEYPQRELVALIAASGQAPTNTLLVQAAQALGRGLWVGDLTGTGDLAVATLGAVFPSLLRGMRIRAAATAANTTAAPKLRVVNLGTAGGTVDFPILKEDGSAPAVGEITPGRRYWYEADGAGNVTISGGGISSSVSTNTALTIVQAAGSPFGLKQYTNPNRRVMSGQGTDVQQSAWDAFTHPKRSANSRLRLDLGFDFRSSTAPGQGNGPSIVYLNVGGQIFRMPMVNSYPGSQALNRIKVFFDGLPAGNTSVSVGFGRYDTAAWAGTFGPTNTDDSGRLPVSTSTLDIDEVILS